MHACPPSLQQHLKQRMMVVFLVVMFAVLTEFDGAGVLTYVLMRVAIMGMHGRVLQDGDWFIPMCWMAAMLHQIGVTECNKCSFIVKTAPLRVVFKHISCSEHDQAAYLTTVSSFNGQLGLQHALGQGAEGQIFHEYALGTL